MSSSVNQLPNRINLTTFRVVLLTGRNVAYSSGVHTLHIARLYKLYGCTRGMVVHVVFVYIDKSTNTNNTPTTHQYTPAHTNQHTMMMYGRYYLLLTFLHILAHITANFQLHLDNTKSNATCDKTVKIHYTARLKYKIVIKKIRTNQTIHQISTTNC
ncbi:hypothetical protein HELRODRAFT_166063 [Helobdella robusta]|uniref:Uncharacterized protein n=1 Tax=Helobdella robusta TaxID=6412 RepID=T1EXP0_HELRO|nr:hypothetical protein HELRODRAFT_166063 [Helobdella robusta]ESN90398.1 hypothetical protein HELRODRAFT_166063 [Helobdella robusta]